MPLNPTLDQPWFQPLATAIPLAGVADPVPPGTRPDYKVIGAQNDWDWTQLPNCVSSWQESQLEMLIRSAVEVGLPKVRRRFTKAHKIISISMPLKKSQYDAFWSMYNVTLKNGLETFMFQNPFNDKWGVYRFTAVPTMNADTDRMLWVSMSWEEM